MSLISTLNNASSALQVFSRAIEVEGANVANAATPGYASRRTSIQPIGAGGSFSGSDYILIESTASALSDAQVQAASSDSGWSQSRAEALSPLNDLFDITGSKGLLAAFRQFGAAFSDAAVTPTDTTLRASALHAADLVATAFRKASSGAQDQGVQIDAAIGNITGEINRLSEQIRSANVRLRTDPSNGAADATRRSALDALSSLVDITATATPDGSVTVLAGGEQPLVVGDQAYALSVSPLSAPPGQVSSAGGGVSPGTYGGKLGGLLDVRNSALAKLIGGASSAGSLNELAKGFASRVNQLLGSGVTSSGAAGVPVFIYDSTNDRNVAATLILDAAVTPAQLALGTGGIAPQANGTANVLARLFSSAQPADWINGRSTQDLFASIATTAGQDLATAKAQASSAQTTLTSATAARQRVSGVSLDESAIAITALQRNYQAAAKLVSILDTLTTTEINLIR